MEDLFDWTEADIVSLVKERAEESLTLEFKACDALLNKKWREELAKDVSAFANSAGGTIIYGIKEDRVTHEASEIDEGFDPDQRNKEALQRVIDSRIHRRIAGIKYSVVQLEKTNPGKILFVLQIPESNLAPHMADYRFFKRLEFESKPMEEYEIRERYRREAFPGKDVVESWRDDAINPLINFLESETNLLSTKEWTWHRFQQAFTGFEVLLNHRSASANKQDFINRHSEVRLLLTRHDDAIVTLNQEGRTLFDHFARSPILQKVFDLTTSEDSLRRLNEENPNSFRGKTAKDFFDELFGSNWNEEQRLECFAQWAINSRTEANVNPMLLFWKTNGSRYHDSLERVDHYRTVIAARQELKGVCESLITLLKQIRTDLSERHNIPHEAKQQFVNISSNPLHL